MNTIIITYIGGRTETMHILYDDADAIFRMYTYRTGVSKVEHFNDEGKSIKAIWPGNTNETNR